MMRHMLITATMIVTIGSNAQSWCPPGAQWVYDVGDAWNVARLQLTYAGDTLVDGFPAQRIDRTYFQTQPMNVITSWDPFFTRTNGDVVWEWNGTEWDTLYWFSAVPGDHWQPFWPYQEVCPDHAWLVQDTSTTVVSGIPLRTLLLELTETGVPTGQTLTIYERMGGGGGFGFPGSPPCGPIYECICLYTCYQDQDIVPPGSPCALPLDVGSLAAPSQDLMVFPNPATDRVAITLPEGPVFHTIEVIGTDGRTVRSTGTPNAATSFSVEDLHEGVYLIRARTDRGMFRSTTLVIAR